MNGINISGRLKALDGDLKSTLFKKQYPMNRYQAGIMEALDCLVYNVAGMIVLSIKN